MRHFKTIILVFLLFQFHLCSSQSLKVNDNKYLSIVFDSNIIQAAVGNAKDYIVDYNTEGEESIVLIKASSSNVKESNLIIKTRNGYLYNINLEYGKEEKNIVSFSKADGVFADYSLQNKSNGEEVKANNTSSISSNQIPGPTQNSVRENDYLIGDTVLNDSMNNKLDCEYCPKLSKATKTIKRIYDVSYNVKIQINNLYYYDNKLYFVVNLNNSSDIDYNLNYIKSYIDSRNVSKNSSTQYLEKNPIGIFNSNRVIKAKTERNYIFVYEQFTIDDNKNLVFEINENNGERNLMLRIPSFVINNPFNIKKL